MLSVLWYTFKYQVLLKAYGKVKLGRGCQIKSLLYSKMTPDFKLIIARIWPISQNFPGLGSLQPLAVTVMQQSQITMDENKEKQGQRASKTFLFIK